MSGCDLQVTDDGCFPLAVDEYGQKEPVSTGLQVDRDRVLVLSRGKVDIPCFREDLVLFKRANLSDRHLEYGILDGPAGVLHADLQGVAAVGHLPESCGEAPGSHGEGGKGKYQETHVSGHSLGEPGGQTPRPRGAGRTDPRCCKFTSTLLIHHFGCYY